jgi:hypothetical protein
VGGADPSQERLRLERMKKQLDKEQQLARVREQIVGQSDRYARLFWLVDCLPA